MIPYTESWLQQFLFGLQFITKTRKEAKLFSNINQKFCLGKQIIQQFKHSFNHIQDKMFALNDHINIQIGLKYKYF